MPSKESSKITTSSVKECVQFGAGYIHEYMQNPDRGTVAKLYGRGTVQMLVVVPSFAWDHSFLRTQVVIVAGTSREDEGKLAVRQAEYHRTDLLKTICLASVRSPGEKEIAVVITETALYQQYKGRCLERLPIESQWRNMWADHINAEVAARVIERKQDAVDYLTWMFFYRRLAKNPSYYGTNGFSHQEIWTELFEIFDTSISELKASGCVAAEGEKEVALGPLNFGTIVARYIRNATLELFASFMTPKTKIRGLIDIFSLTFEFDGLSVRVRKEEALQIVPRELPISIDEERSLSFCNPHMKAYILRQAHLSRLRLAGELAKDQARLLPVTLRLIGALVDVIPSAGWLKPGLCAVELSQMVMQGIWDFASPLLQLPCLDESMAATLPEKHGVADIFGFLDMEEENRSAVLQWLSKKQVLDIATTCQQFPDMEGIDVEYIQKTHDEAGQSQRRAIVQTRRDEGERKGG